MSIWFDIFVIGSLIAITAALFGLLLWQVLEDVPWTVRKFKNVFIASVFAAVAIMALNGAVGYAACVLLVMCVLEGLLLLRESTR